MTSTVYLVGFPSDTTTRELENVCRFFPGYVGATPSFTKGPMVWVRFHDPDCAVAAIPFLDGQPFDLQDPSSLMRASIAKTDTNPRPPGSSPLITLAKTGGTCAPGGGSAVRSLQDLVKDAPAAKKQRVEVASTQSDTLVLFGIGEKGYTEDDLLGYFQQIEGYVTLMCTNASGKGGGNCFIKFEGTEAAQAAIEVAKYSELELEVARTSLNVPGMTPFVPPPTRSSWSVQSPAKQAPSSGTMDTLVVFQLANKGVTEEELNYSVFGHMDGFVGLQVSNGKGGGNCFIRFESGEHAQDAMKAAPEALNVQMARTSLNIRA